MLHQACQRVALTTGIILDPVYSGKALFQFLREAKEEPERWRGRNVLFVQ